MNFFTKVAQIGKKAAFFSRNLLFPQTKKCYNKTERKDNANFKL